MNSQRFHQAYGFSSSLWISEFASKKSEQSKCLKIDEVVLKSKMKPKYQLSVECQLTIGTAYKIFYFQMMP